MFIKTPKEYVSNFFGRVQLTFTNLFFAFGAIIGFKPEMTMGIVDRGDTNEKRPEVPLEKVAEWVAWATRMMDGMGVKQSDDGMCDCPNMVALKAALINAKASMEGYKGASIAGRFGYRRDVDGKGHELVQIIYAKLNRIFAEGHQRYANLRGISKTEEASCQLDIIG